MRRLFLAISFFCALSLPIAADAAIAFDSSGTRGSASNTNSVSYSHTVVSNTNGIMWIAIEMNGSNASTPITAVAFNGVAASDTGLFIHNASFSDIALWCILVPATGAHNVTVSASTATIRNVYSYAYTGAKQTCIPDASGTDNNSQGSVGTLTETLTTVADNPWGFMMGTNTGGTSFTDGTVHFRNTSAAELSAGDTNSALTPAGSKNLTWSTTGNSQWITIFVSFAPAVAASAAVKVPDIITDL